tara:strand:+ start:1740 stop:2120 length:381 start_codon:yes stop_codon:yes gene_type:complete
MKESKQLKDIMIRHNEEIENLIIRFINKYNGNTKELKFDVSEMATIVKMFCVNYNELKYQVDEESFTVTEFINIVGNLLCCIIKNISCIYSVNFRNESEYEDAICYFQESLSDILDDTQKLYDITE